MVCVLQSKLPQSSPVFLLYWEPFFFLQKHSHFTPFYRLVRAVLFCFTNLSLFFALLSTDKLLDQDVLFSFVFRNNLQMDILG